MAYRKVTSYLVPCHQHHRMTKARLLHLHPGTSACRSHLKFPIFLTLPAKTPAPAPSNLWEASTRMGTREQKPRYSLQTVTQRPGMHLNKRKPKRMNKQHREIKGGSVCVCLHLCFLTFTQGEKLAFRLNIH